MFNESIIVIHSLFPNVREKVEKYISELKDIKIYSSGQDLIDMGFKPSPVFKEVFDLLLQAKLNGLIKNKDNEISFIKQKIKSS